jgi:hypothetical protein
MQMELRKHLREGDVVLSDIYTSWSIPVLTHIFLNYKITGEDIKPALQEMGFSVIAQNESFCLFSVFRTTRNPQLEPRIENAIPVSRITNSHT